MSAKGLERLFISGREEPAEEAGFDPPKAPTLLFNVNNPILEVP